MYSVNRNTSQIYCKPHPSCTKSVWSWSCQHLELTLPGVLTHLWSSVFSCNWHKLLPQNVHLKKKTKKPILIKVQKYWKMQYIYKMFKRRPVSLNKDILVWITQFYPHQLSNHPLLKVRRNILYPYVKHYLNSIWTKERQHLPTSIKSCNFKSPSERESAREHTALTWLECKGTVQKYL